MGRNCGWLTAATACEYEKIKYKEFLPEIGLYKEKWDVHSVLLPEKNIDFELECDRLKIMNKYDCVNIFLSEGFGDIIISEEKNGEKILRDAFGHVRLDDLNPGKWFAKNLGYLKLIKYYYKSGYLVDI